MQDIAKIDQLSVESLDKFWRGIQSIRDRITKARSQGRKVVGASSHEELDVDDMVVRLINVAALSLVVSAVNSGIVSANQNVSDNEPTFLFNTVGDDRVCPICEPLDNEVMKDSDGSLMEPPLHDSCRCFLIPLV